MRTLPPALDTGWSSSVSASAGAASIAHTLAALALEMAKVGRPPEIHFGWTEDSPVSGTLGFLLFAEGNVPWMVRDLIRRAEPDETRRPVIIIAGAA